jgi:hypothetical protein
MELIIMAFHWRVIGGTLLNGAIYGTLVWLVIGLWLGWAPWYACFLGVTAIWWPFTAWWVAPEVKARRFYKQIEEERGSL